RRRPGPDRGDPSARTEPGGAVRAAASDLRRPLRRPRSGVRRHASHPLRAPVRHPASERIGPGARADPTPPLPGALTVAGRQPRRRERRSRRAVLPAIASGLALIAVLAPSCSTGKAIRPGDGKRATYRGEADVTAESAALVELAEDYLQPTILRGRAAQRLTP